MTIDQEKLGQIIQYATEASLDVIVDLEFSKEELAIQEKSAVKLFNVVEKLEDKYPMLLSGNTLGLNDDEKILASFIVYKMIQTVGDLHTYYKGKIHLSENESKFIELMSRIEKDFKVVYEQFTLIVAGLEKHLGKSFYEYANGFTK